MTRPLHGLAFALLWALSWAVGALALRRTPPSHARRCALLLVWGLLPEAAGWLAWGNEVRWGYELAQAVSCVVLVGVVVVQLQAWREA